MTVNTTITDYDGGEIQIVEVTTGLAGRSVEVFTGTAPPAVSKGANGDLYIVVSGVGIGDLYKKISGAWAVQGNLRGPGLTSINGKIGPEVTITAADITGGVFSINVLPVGTTTGTVAAGDHRHDAIYEPVLPVPGNNAMYLRGDKTWANLTKGAIGLPNVDNTSDALKPISAATQTALDGKAPIAHTHDLQSPTITGVLPVAKLPIGNTAAHVAAGNHTHTPGSIGAASLADITAVSLADRSRANHTGTQPASTITGLAQIALTGNAADITIGKLPISVLPDAAITKVTTVASDAAMLALPAQEGDIAIRTDSGKSYVLGPGLSTTLSNWKMLGAETGVASVAGKTGVVTLVKSDVGLSSVDNTSDATKPVSTAQQAALDLKASVSHFHDGSHITTGLISIDRLPIAGPTESSATKVIKSDDPRLTNARTPVAHLHDDRYYTETEMTALLLNKADLVHIHEMDEIDQLDYTLSVMSSRINEAAGSAISAGNAATSASNGVAGLVPQIVNAAAAAQNAIQAAESAMGFAQSKTKTYYQGTEPTTGVNIGDVWINTAQNNTMSIYGSTGWENAASSINAEAEAQIAAAVQKANAALAESTDAMEAANNASQSSQDAADAAAAALAAANNTIRTYYSPEPPWADNSTQPASALGALWFDLDTDVAHRWTGTEWKMIRDDAISDALAAAQDAANAAAASSKVYIQPTAPVGRTQDLWIDTTGGNNVPKRWNGSAWIVATDKTAAEASAAFAALGSRVTATEGSITQTNNNISGINSQISTLETTIQTEQGRITSLNNTVAGVDSRVSNVTTQMQTVEGNITLVNNRVDNTNTAIDQQSTIINGVKTDVTAIQTSKNKITYSPNPPGSAAQVKGDIWFQRNASKEVTAQYEATGLAGAAGWQSVVITGTALAKLDAGTITVGKLSAEVISAAELQAGIIATGGLNASIITAGKISSQFLETGSIIISPSQVAGLNNMLADSELVSKAYADSVEVGAINLFTGGLAEQGGTARLVKVGVSDALAGLAGEDVTLSFEVKGTAAGSIQVRPEPSNGLSITNTTTIPITTGWVRHTITDVVKSWPVLAGQPGSIGFYDPTNANQKVSVRKIKIERGLRATEWSPSQGDVDGAIADAEARAVAAGRDAGVAAIKNIWGFPTDSTRIDGGNIYTNSIKATSIQLADFNNYWPDRYFVDSTTGQFAVTTPEYAEVPPGGGKAVVLQSRDHVGSANTPFIAARAGDEFLVSVTYKRVAGTNAFIPGIWMYNANKVSLATPWAGIRTRIDFNATTPDESLGNGWFRTHYKVVIPASSTDAAFVKLWLQINQEAPYADKVAVTDIVFMRRNGAKLIVDGSIETKHIITNGLDASVIKFGVMHGNRIQANTITANQLSVLFGSGNLYDNSSFISTTPLLPVWGPATTAHDTTTAYEGTGSLKVTSNNATAPSGWGVSLNFGETIGPDNRVKPNTSYVASAWVKFPATNAPADLKLGPPIGSAIASSDPEVRITSTPGGWTKMQTKFKTSASGTFSLLLFSTAAAVGTNFFVGAIQLEEGEIGTGYKPKAQELLPGTIQANMLKADAIDGKIITGATIQTSNSANVSVVKIIPAGILAYGPAVNGVPQDATFVVNASTGSVQMKGSILSGSNIEGATITGVLQTTTDANRGVKISNGGILVYGSNATGPFDYKVAMNSTGDGYFYVRGPVVSGGDISGATVTGGTIRTDSRDGFGIKIANAGMTVYNAFTNEPTLTVSQYGAIAMAGSLTTGSSITGSSVTSSTMTSSTITGSWITTPTQAHSEGQSSAKLVQYGTEVTGPWGTPGAGISQFFGEMMGGTWRTGVRTDNWFGSKTEMLVYANGRVNFVYNTNVNASVVRMGSMQAASVILGNDGNSVVAPGIRQTTSSGGDTLQINPNNDIVYRVVSGLQHKVAVKPLQLNGRSILDITPITYLDKHHLERKAAGDKNWQHEPRTQVGFSAESFVDAGFEDLVNFDKDGMPDSLQYDRITPLMVVEIKQKFDEMENRIKELEALAAGRLAQLESKGKE